MSLLQDQSAEYFVQDQSAEYFVAFLAGIKSVLPMEEVLNLKQQDFYFDDGEVKLFNTRSLTKTAGRRWCTGAPC